MNVRALRERLCDRYQRWSSRAFFQRVVAMHNKEPLISFTFDDFPHSAFRVGGAILKEHECRGTFYASFGLMGRNAPVGPIFCSDDLRATVAEGHELGCHTFSHCHSWSTPSAEFEESVTANQRALSELMPPLVFKTLSYPISTPRPATKRRMAKRFACCRGGGQTFNRGTIDLNYVRAFFLEKSGGDPAFVHRLIDQNAQERGWLIFATHDVADNPTPFGCTPSFFEQVVERAKRSGASILPVSEALAEVMPHRTISGAANPIRALA